MPSRHGIRQTKRKKTYKHMSDWRLTKRRKWKAHISNAKRGRGGRWYNDGGGIVVGLGQWAEPSCRRQCLRYQRRDNGITGTDKSRSRLRHRKWVTSHSSRLTCQFYYHWLGLHTGAHWLIGVDWVSGTTTTLAAGLSISRSKPCKIWDLIQNYWAG